MNLRLLGERRISRTNVTKRGPSVGGQAWDLPISKMLRGGAAVTGSCLEFFGDPLVLGGRCLSKISRHEANILLRRASSGNTGARECMIPGARIRLDAGGLAGG